MIATVMPAVGEQILLAEKILAVVGGAVVGGLMVGLLAQLLARAIVMRKLPRVPLLVTRLFGAVIGGWLVALWVFGGGGPGFGGRGGGWLGSGTGEGEKTSVATQKEVESKKTNGERIVSDSEKLRIEVLVKEVLKKLHADESHCYRVDAEDRPRLLTLEGVQKEIKIRQGKQPPLRRIEIVLYKDDSPAPDAPVVKSLQNWASDLEVKGAGKMEVTVILSGTDAPMK